jgi:hypothetical protein
MENGEWKMENEGASFLSSVGAAQIVGVIRFARKLIRQW